MSRLLSLNPKLYPLKTIRLASLLIFLSTLTAKSEPLPLIKIPPVKYALAYVWTGLSSSDWNDAGNWDMDAVPTSTDDVVIAVGSYNPEITTVASVNNLIITAGGTLTVTGGTLQIAADITNIAGTLDVSNGTVELIGTSTQTIPADVFLNNTVKNLIISNDTKLDGLSILTGTLTIADGRTLTTNDNLVLKSDMNGTARIAELPTDGFGNATAFIDGKVSIERYIPMRKAWRLLGVPVKTTDAPLINDAFQEGVGTSSLNDNPNPGYGVFVLGGSTFHGFDQSLTNNSTIKVFDNASGNFLALAANPGTMRAITDYPGYFLYVRGDRGINLALGNAAETTPTTLRMKGSLNTGDVTSAVNATGYTVFGNPYPSAIDFETLTKNNVKNSFYVWDPKLSGTYGLGGYVTFSWNSGTGTYDATTSVSPLSKYIPSGEAIIIESDDAVNPGSITVKESDKTTSGSDDVFGRPVTPVIVNTQSQQVRVNMYSLNADGSTVLLDGVLTTYNGHNSNSLDKNDSKKLNGGSENIGIKRQDKMLSIERRKTITTTDTTFLNIYQMKIANYQLKITADNMNKAGVTAVIKDRYSNTINNMPLDMNSTTAINFSVNADPASYAINRFSIVFMPKKGLHIPAEVQKSNSIAVEKVTKKKAINNSAAAMLVYPNPVAGNTISVQLNNIEKGNYTLQLFNSNGQVVAAKTIQHDGVNTVKSFEVNERFAAGKYELRMVGNTANFSSPVIKQ